MDDSFKYKKQPLSRSARALSSFVSPALQSILSSWTGQLLSSITKERDRVQSRGRNLEDLAVEELAVLDATERMLRNLYAVAIYHILEQHLIAFFYRQAGTALAKTPTEMDKQKPQFYDVVQEIKNAWAIDLKNVSSWDTIDEVRMVANCVKHGDGPDCGKLRKTHPDWFDRDFITPLSGEGLKLPNDYLEKGIEAIEKFLSEFTDEINKIEK
jgi:hypothetical protein